MSFMEIAQQIITFFYIQCLVPFNCLLNHQPKRVIIWCPDSFCQDYVTQQPGTSHWSAAPASRCVLLSLRFNAALHLHLSKSPSWILKSGLVCFLWLQAHSSCHLQWSINLNLLQSVEYIPPPAGWVVWSIWNQRLLAQAKDPGCIVKRPSYKFWFISRVRLRPHQRWFTAQVQDEDELIHLSTAGCTVAHELKLKHINGLFLTLN